MTTTGFEVLRRPAPTVDHAAPSRFRPIGIAIGLAGLAAVAVALVANVVAASDLDRSTLAWSFGLTTTGFATLKLGIAVTLMGILVRLWMRVEAVKATLPRLKAAAQPEAEGPHGDFESPYGRATASPRTPGPLLVHRMARVMWAPMLAMGLMAVVGGLVVSIVQASSSSASDFETLGAWVQGLQFLGEGLILAGISFLLGTILASLRAGGGEAQEALGLTVKTLRMPRTAKLFVGLMMVGVMVAGAQFALYLVAAYGDVDTAVWLAWLAPLRELGLGLLLSGIVLALATIGTVLGFQFDRIKEIIASGR
jgi:hypothetical protein